MHCVLDMMHNTIFFACFVISFRQPVHPCGHEGTNENEMVESVKEKRYFCFGAT